MAEKQADSYRSIGNLKGAAGEADARALRDKQRRQNADTGKLLLPTDRRAGPKKWDPGKVLETTLGAGEWSTKRKLTASDLQAIAKSIKQLGDKFERGITPRQVIDLSLPSRLKRAREEILMAVPSRCYTTSNSAVIRFVTNAGPETKAKPPRHHVTVEIRRFNTAVEAVHKPPKMMAREVCKWPVLFDCDCEDHTFRFRYIASAAGFNYGREERAFPKIRNPSLSGVACKHVIRVMQQIDAGRGAFTNMLAKLIEQARKSNQQKATVQLTQKQAESIAKKQEKTPAKIKTTEDRRAQTEAARNAKIAKKLTQATKKAATWTKPSFKLQMTQSRPELSDPHQAARTSLKALGYSDAQIEAMLQMRPENA